MSEIKENLLKELIEAYLSRAKDDIKIAQEWDDADIVVK